MYKRIRKAHIKPYLEVNKELNSKFYIRKGSVCIGIERKFGEYLIMTEHKLDTLSEMKENINCLYYNIKIKEILDKYAKCKFIVYETCKNTPKDQFVVVIELIKFKINM